MQSSKELRLDVYVKILIYEFLHGNLAKRLATYRFIFPSHDPAFLESTLSSCFSFKYLVRRSMVSPSPNLVKESGCESTRRHIRGGGRFPPPPQLQL